MYTIHQSKAFIIDAMDTSEKNRFFWLFTRDFGLIAASAQGLRTVTSKLNPILQQYSTVSVEFVRGKDVWRITNALSLEEGESFSFSSFTKKGQEVLARTSLLLRRLYVGEEAHSELFDDVVEGLLKISKSFDSRTIDALETLLILKILYHLGYWEEHKEHYPLHLSPFSRETVEKTLQKKYELEERIKQSLRESHL